MAKGGSKRDRQKEFTWRRHLAAQAECGLSVRAFCRRRSISEQGFHWWRRELARRDAQKAAPAFVPVEVSASTTPAACGLSLGAIEIVLPGDRLVRLTGPVNRQQLADVLAAMEAQEQGTC